jgi:hypothetical protein
VEERAPRIPRLYTADLADVVSRMLEKSVEHRPDIATVLELPAVVIRVRQMMNVGVMVCVVFVFVVMVTVTIVLVLVLVLVLVFVLVLILCWCSFYVCVGSGWGGG